MKLSVAFSRIHCRKSHLRRAVEIQGAQRVFYRPKSTQSALKRINTMSQDSVVRRFFRRAGDAASSSGVSKATMQLSSTILQDINKILQASPGAVKELVKATLKSGFIGFVGGGALIAEYYLLSGGNVGSYLGLLTLSFPFAFCGMASIAGFYKGLWRSLYHLTVKSGFVTDITKDLSSVVMNVYVSASGQKAPVVPVEQFISLLDNYFASYNAWAQDKLFLLRWTMPRMTSLLRSFVLGLLPGEKNVAVEQFVSQLAGKRVDDIFYGVTETMGQKPMTVVWALWFASACAMAGYFGFFV